MITRLSRKMASFFVYKKIIDAKNEEVYEYGMELLLSTVFNGIIALIIALATRTFVPSLLFLASFVCMRKSAGGFHAKTHLGCCIILAIVLSLFIAFTKLPYENLYSLISALALLISLIVNFLFAPLEHENKPLSDEDKIRLRHTSMRYYLIFIAVVILMYVLKSYLFMISISLGMFTSACSILFAKIQKMPK